MDDEADAEAWGDFWADNAGSNGSGCLPGRWQAIERVQSEAWHGFVADLPERGEVLDLATGDGRVLRWIHAARPDLVLNGIDLAPDLPSAPDGTTTQGSIAMEDLPFADNAFDAVTSQFGFEYGDVAKVAAEVTRVLEPGGTVGLMVHRGDGPILAHNLRRLDAIEWVLEEVDVTGAVGKALEAPGAGAGVAAQVAGAVAILGANKFGESSPAWEIPEALRRSCVLGGPEGTGSIHAAISEIAQKAENEIGRIRSLERACAAADDRDTLIGGFTSLGFEHYDTAVIAEPSGRAFADFLTLNLPD